MKHSFYIYIKLLKQLVAIAVGNNIWKVERRFRSLLLCLVEQDPTVITGSSWYQEGPPTIAPKMWSLTIALKQSTKKEERQNKNPSPEAQGRKTPLSFVLREGDRMFTTERRELTICSNNKSFSYKQFNSQNCFKDPINKIRKS